MAKAKSKTQTRNLIPLRSLLQGCTPGRLQSVGLMQVVPLVSDCQEERFLAPDEGARIATCGYGSLVIKNQLAAPMLVPCGATYIVPQAAQNHALPHAGFVAAEETKTYTTAVCVQAGQGGYIREEAHELMLLPFPLREAAYQVRREVNCGRLWPAITELNQQAGLPPQDHRGHLELFFDRFKTDLDTFVAQFEPVPQQVGAIVLVNGKVAGIERTPSARYFLSVWRPLIRECYGSLALLEARSQEQPAVPRTRTALRPVTSLTDLQAALTAVEQEEFRRVATLVENLLAIELERRPEETVAGCTVDALGPHPFVGEMIRDGEKIVYASVVATKSWRAAQDWLEAREFSMGG
jgi:hypothetical protein